MPRLFKLKTPADASVETPAEKISDARQSGGLRPSKARLLGIVALLSVGSALAFSPLSQTMQDRAQTVATSGNTELKDALVSLEADKQEALSDTRSRADLAPAAPAGRAAQEFAAEPAQNVAQDLQKSKQSSGELPPLDSKVAAPEPALSGLGQGYNAPGYLIKAGSLQLESDDIQQAFGRVSALTDKYQGYLVNSSLSNYGQGTASATLQVKLPSGKLSAALTELDALGTVRSKQITTEDIWLQLQQQRLEIEYLQDTAKTSKSSTPASRHQIRQQQLERLRLEQSLRMATLEITLTQKPAIWNLAPLGTELGQKAQQSLTVTARLLADVLLYLPPVLVFLGLAWLGWLLLGHLLITRLGLMAERPLAGVYLLALVFFPLYAVGGLGAAGAFSILLGLIWAGSLLVAYLRRKPVPAVQPVQTGTPGLSE